MFRSPRHGGRGSLSGGFGAVGRPRLCYHENELTQMFTAAYFFSQERSRAMARANAWALQSLDMKVR
eukprot:12238384-Alexandrium_andersonii.AAC.1